MFIPNQTAMINYFITKFRGMVKQTFYTIINVLCLTVTTVGIVTIPSYQAAMGQQGEIIEI